MKFVACLTWCALFLLTSTNAVNLLVNFSVFQPFLSLHHAFSAAFSLSFLFCLLVNFGAMGCIVCFFWTYVNASDFVVARRSDLLFRLTHVDAIILLLCCFFFAPFCLWSCLRLAVQPQADTLQSLLTLMLGALLGLVFAVRILLRNRLTLMWPTSRIILLQRVRSAAAPLPARCLRCALRLVLYSKPLYLLLTWLLFNGSVGAGGNNSYLWTAFSLGLTLHHWMAAAHVLACWSFAARLARVYLTLEPAWPLVNPLDECDRDTALAALEAAPLQGQNARRRLVGAVRLATLLHSCSEQRAAVWTLSPLGGRALLWCRIREASVVPLEQLLADVRLANTRLMDRGSEVAAALPSALLSEKNQSRFLQQARAGFAEHSHSRATPAQHDGTARRRVLLEGGGSSSLRPLATPLPSPSIGAVTVMTAPAGGVTDWWSIVGAIAVSAQAMSSAQSQLWMLRALVTLMGASFTEDQCGVLQADLGRLLNCLVRLNEALERHYKLLLGSGVVLPSEEQMFSPRPAIAFCYNESSVYLFVQLRKELATGLGVLSNRFGHTLLTCVGLELDCEPTLRTLLQQQQPPPPPPPPPPPFKPNHNGSCTSRIGI